MKCGNCHRNSTPASDQRREVERRARGGPAHEHRNGAGDGADGRVERRARLERRVDDDVEHPAREAQRGGQ